MPIDMQDKSGQPRREQELIEAQLMIKKEVIGGKIIPHMMIHYPVIIEAIDEVIITRRESKIYKHLLQNLLAIVHRDGGHYTQRHRIEKSVEDAIEVVGKLRMEIDRLQYLLIKSS
jgi:hypothetical protein